MTENRIYAYCRVSKNDGTMTIDNQIHAIELYAKEHNITISNFYKDECKGDTPIDKRKQLPVLLDNLRTGDTVIVVEVFRLYRSFRGLEEVYRTIVEDKKCEFITLNPQEQILCTSNQDKEDIIQQSVKSLILVCMALFSSLEKKNISERTKRSLKQRKDSGKKLGRPTVEVPEKYAEFFKLAVEGQRTHAQNMREFNLKKTSYYKIAKELGLKTNKRSRIFD